MPSHIKTPPVNVSSRGTLFCNVRKGEKAARVSHYALKRLQHEARCHMTTPTKILKSSTNRPVTSHLIQQVSEVQNSLTINPFPFKQEETSFSAYTDIPEDPLQSDKAYTLAMEIVDALMNKDSSTLDQRLISYMQLPNTGKHDGDLILPQPCVDNSFSREMQALLETIDTPGVDPQVKNHAQFRYKNIALNFFLKALSHRDAVLAQSAKQLLTNMENHFQKISDAQQKLYCSTVAGQFPPLTLAERFDPQSTILINRAHLKAAKKATEKESDEILDKISRVTQLNRRYHPVLQHYAGKVHGILTAVDGEYAPTGST